jgi:opacity protein-like surface antigen
MEWMMRIAAATMTLFLLASCSMSADSRLAEDAVPQFHHALDAGDFDAIYEGSANDLKQAASQKDFLDLLEAVHRKLGLSQSSNRQGWNVNYNTAGTFVTLSFQTTYAEGKASEQFVYRLQDGKALLAGYHISSLALITK